MYHELTVWSRGIIMDKEARDVSSCIAAAARALGFHADNVSDYVDDPDRTNCLVRRYARFGDSPIVDRFVYENPRPDWVVLVEETIVKAVNFLRGTPDGAGVLVVNSARADRGLAGHVPGRAARVPLGRAEPLAGRGAPLGPRPVFWAFSFFVIFESFVQIWRAGFVNGGWAYGAVTVIREYLADGTYHIMSDRAEIELIANAADPSAPDAVSIVRLP